MKNLLATDKILSWIFGFLYIFASIKVLGYLNLNEKSLKELIRLT